MKLFTKYRLNSDYLGIYRRYTPGSCFIDPGTAMLMAGGMGAAGDLAGGMMGGKTKKPKRYSTFSRNQKGIDRSLYDLLMGIRRDEKGKELSRNPWLEQMMEKRPPIQRVAQFTDNQQGVLDMAGGMANKIGSRQGPDMDYLKSLGRPQPSKLNYAAVGGQFNAGDTVVVGEDGPEIVQALPGGGFEVIPNPETMSSPSDMAQGMAKGKAVQEKVGLPGAVLGGKIGSKRNYQGNWIDDSVYGFGNDWTDADAAGYGQGLRAEYDDYLKQGYQDWQKTGDRKQFLDFDPKSYQENKDKWNWYEDFSGTSDFGKRQELSGDITKAKYNTYGGGPKAGQLKNDRLGGVQTGYYSGLNDYLDANYAATNTNEALNTAMAGIGVDQYSDFRNWYEGAGNPYRDAENSVVVRDNRVSMENPFINDMTSFQGALDAYGDYRTSEGGPDYVPPEVDTTGANDWAGTLSQIDPEQYGAFNQSLTNFQGGVMEGMGVNWDPTTGEYAFGAEDNYFPGMNQAVDSFLAGQSTGGDGTTDPNVTIDPNGNPVVGSSDQLNNIQNSLLQYTDTFDPTNANANFDASIYDPAVQSFNENVVTGINQNFAGSNFFGSGREKAIQSSRDKMEDSLTATRGTYMQQAEEAHKARGLAASNAMQNLYKLPEQTLTAQANIEHIDALTNSVFHDMEWANALNGANLDNQSLTSLALLWQIFSPEQAMDQAELNAAMTNAFNADGGFDFASVLPIIMGYQDQSQIAFG